MEEKKANELTDRALNDVAGGGTRRLQKEPQATCLRCGRELPRSAVPGGYCMSCREELAKQNSFPPI